jgi:hypothetical protein
VSCGHGSTQGGARDVSLSSARTRQDAETNKTPVSQAELQDSIQRFTGTLMDRLAQALGDVARNGTPEESEAALRAAILYASSALDIASGPLPEVNVLDMIVFIRLCRESFETHWMPELYGEKGKPVLEAFRVAEGELRHIAARVLTPQQLARLDAFIEQWRHDNPNQFRVESVRLMDFSVRAGQVELARAREAGGLMASVKGATQAADQALLIAERGLFLAQRMPFLVRLQARLGSREIISDALAKVGSPAELMTQVQGFEPMVEQLPVLAERSGQAAHEARLLVNDVQPLIPSSEGAEKINATIAKTNELTVNTRHMLQELKALVPSDPNAVVATAQRGVDDTLKKGLLYLALLGGAWSAVWWGGYYLVKRRLARHAHA